MNKSSFLDFIETSFCTERVRRFVDSCELSKGFAIHPLAGCDERRLCLEVFGLKSRFMLGSSRFDNQECIERLLGFRTVSGKFIDSPAIIKALPSLLWGSVVSRKFPSVANLVRAETRQAVASLRLFDSDFEVGSWALSEIRAFREPAALKKFVSSLNWSDPWGAGSQIAHLCFLEELIASNPVYGVEPERIKEATKQLVLKYFDNDGLVGSTDVSARNRVNGMMKLCMAYGKSVQSYFPDVTHLFEVIRKEAEYRHACDFVNVLVILDALTGFDRELDKQIQCFVLENANIFIKHWRVNSGAFSFYPEHCQTKIYGSSVSRPIEIADLHGTVMCLWGLGIACKLLNKSHVIGLNAYTP